MYKSRFIYVAVDAVWHTPCYLGRESVSYR